MLGFEPKVFVYAGQVLSHLLQPRPHSSLANLIHVRSHRLRNSLLSLTFLSLLKYNPSLCPRGCLPDPWLPLSLASSPFSLKGVLVVADLCNPSTVEAILHSEFQASLGLCVYIFSPCIYFTLSCVYPYPCTVWAEVRGQLRGVGSLLPRWRASH